MQKINVQVHRLFFLDLSPSQEVGMKHEKHVVIILCVYVIQNSLCVSNSLCIVSSVPKVY